MFATFPITPQGRSRSKMVDLPEKATSQKPLSPKATTVLLESPLPPLPQDEMPGAIAIPRRPVAAKQSKASLMSSSSDYSEAPGLSRSLSSSSNHEHDSLSGFESDVGATPPPLPPKDDGEQKKVNAPESPVNILSSPISNFNTSPQTELWRRRSQKSDRGIIVPVLKLDKSNGSTASPPRRKEQPERPTLPRSLRGRKPVPSRPAPPQPDLMGNKLAKLKIKGTDDLSSGSAQNEALAKPYPSFQQLPIPEYLNKENEPPRSPHVVSPLSPFSPGHGNPPAVPQKSESRATSSAAASKSSEPSESSDSTTRPTPVSPHSRQPSETLTITSEPSSVIRSPQPHKPNDVVNLLTPQQASHRRVPSLATDFPMLSSPIDTGAISTAPPLELTHFKCYHFHKYMRSSNNTSCPVACMICQREDTETRWRCTWCCLSACRACLQVLSSIPGKDLKECLERVAK